MEMYLGVDGIAREASDIFLGVDGIARKVKKAYIGVGGVARPFFSYGEISYYGQIERLNISKEGIAATGVGDYILFAGGRSGDRYLDEVDIYHKSTLVKVGVRHLNSPKCSGSAASTEDYAVIVGGGVGYAEANFYNKDLVLTYNTDDVYRFYDLIGKSFDKKAWFAGGIGNDAKLSREVFVYDNNLLKTNLELSSEAPYTASMGSATLEDYILFAGGRNRSENTASAFVTGFNKNMVYVSVPSMSISRRRLSGASNKKLAFFSGGSLNNSDTVVDTYDNNLVRGATITSVNRIDGKSDSLGGFPVFAAGRSKLVEIYDKYSSVKIDEFSIMNDGYWGLGLVANGNTMMIAGGCSLETGEDCGTCEVLKLS